MSFPISPTKSFSDKREYRIIKLKNGIEAILISDPETDKAGAALDVHVGHFSDPDHVPGLAHFLEHMLFMGTKKYPDENIYSKLISQYGGQSNAFTSTENTNYYFDVIPENLEKILDLFASFFTEPLFTPGATGREMKAVHSENAQNLLNDNWRLFQLLKTTSNPKHPFSKFGTGNLETLRDAPAKLKIDTRDELLKFHKDLYSANIMKLCILGKQSLDDLEKLAVSRFSDVENKSISVPKWQEEAYHKDSLGKLYEIVPIKDMRQLHMIWPLPGVREHYKKKPNSLLSHLIGHEGAGSILSLLKKKGWANGLSAGLNQECTGFSSFGVSIELTPKGLEHYQNIILVVYQYINIVLKTTDEQWKQIFEECRDVSAMNFRFKGKESPFRYCSSVAGKMHKYALNDILEGPWKYVELDINLVRSLLERFKVDNMRVHLVSQSFKGKTELKEKWYNADYNIKPLDEKLVKVCQECKDSKELSLPAPNEFIATDFSLVIKAEDVKDKTPVLPSKIIDKPGLVVWHKTDNVFHKPKGMVYISMASPHLFDSPRSYVLADLFVVATEDSLAEFSYDASLASLSYSLSLTKKGMQLKVSGYTHKLHNLLYKVLDRIKALTVDEGSFNRLKEMVARRYANFYRNQPYMHALYNQGRSMESGKWSISSKIDEIKTITVSALQEYAKTVMDSSDLEVLIHGNFSETKAREIASGISSSLSCKPLPPSKRPQLRCVDLAKGTTYSLQRRGYNEGDVNSCITALYQIGEESYPILARLSMLAHLFREPAFNQLRTKEQLGYTVWSADSNIVGALCFIVIIQSPTQGGAYLDERVEAFVAKFRGDLAKFDKAEFEANRDALIKKKLEKDKTMGQEANRHWGEILYQQYKFDRVPEIVKELKSISLEDVVTFYDKYIAIGATRAKVSTQVYGKDQVLPGEDTKCKKEEKAKEKAEEEKKDEGKKEEAAEPLPPVPTDTAKKVVIDDFDAFFRGMPLYPCFYK